MLRLETAPIGLETQPEARCRIQSYAFGCLQGAYIASLRRSCKQKTAPKDRFNRFIFLKKTGAGEGIRTLDPNLGKRRQSLRLTSICSAALDFAK